MERSRAKTIKFIGDFISTINVTVSAVERIDGQNAAVVHYGKT